MKNGTTAPSYGERSAHVGIAASRSASATAEPSPLRASARKEPSPTTAPSSASAVANSAISSCSGSWPKAAATAPASSRRSSAAVHGPRARRPASIVRKPDRPGGLRSVGNQPEPKLTALSWSENAARSSSGVPGARSGAGGEAAGSVAA